MDTNTIDYKCDPDPFQIQQECLTLDLDECSTAVRIDGTCDQSMNDSVHDTTYNNASMIQPLQNSMAQEKQDKQNESVTVIEDFTCLPEIKEENDKSISITNAVIILTIIFLASSLVLVYLYHNFPEFTNDEKQYIKIPFSIEDAQKLGKVLKDYKDTYHVLVLLTISFCYIFLHTFSIPGSFPLSILCGFLYPFFLAMGMICFCTAMGSTFCYLLSLAVGRKLAYAYFPDKIKSYAALVKKHEDNVLFVVMFWRIIPFFPSLLINICAPLVDVPLLPFWAGTFIGVAVPSGLAIQAGKTLKDLNSSTDLWSWPSILLLVTFAILSLLPILYKAKIRDKFD